MKKVNLVLTGALVIAILLTGCGGKESKVNTQTNGIDNRVKINNSSSEANKSNEQSQQQKGIGESQKNIEKKADTAANNGNVYNNSKYKFSLTFPQLWSGKYFIEEKGNGIEVYYNSKIANKKSNPFFSIGVTKKSEWIENSGAPTKKISEQNGLVYYADFPTQVGFSAGLESEKSEAEEYTRLNKDTERIINSFKLIK